MTAAQNIPPLWCIIAHHSVYLCNKLDDFDEDVERHVSRYHTAGSFGEKRCYDGVETTADTETRRRYEDTSDKPLKLLKDRVKLHRKLY